MHQRKEARSATHPIGGIFGCEFLTGGRANNNYILEFLLIDVWVVFV